MNEMNFQVRERFLEKQTFSSKMAVDRNLLELKRLPEDYITGRLEYQINAYIFSEKMGAHTVRVPENWWEHLKKDHAPAWFLKRWPIKWHETELEAFALFPEYVTPQGVGQPWSIIREIPHMNWSYQ